MLKINVQLLEKNNTTSNYNKSIIHLICSFIPKLKLVSS